MPEIASSHRLRPLNQAGKKGRPDRCYLIVEVKSRVMQPRRLTLARAIYATPDVILADEPTADLDAATAKAVTAGLMAQVAHGATLVISTHDAALAAQMDRVIQIGGAP